MVKIKKGNDEITVGHRIRVKMVKNKVAPPFRKAEFMIYYDGREMNKSDEIGEVALTYGLIPKYDSQGNISPTGRTYKISCEDEELIARKKDDVIPELRKYPKIQNMLLEKIKNGIEEESTPSIEMDSDLSDEEFEEKLLNGELDNSEAEEIEDWDNV